MVSSTVPPPRRPEGPTPLELAHSLVNRPRFAFFTDKRGVVYCEEVDHRKLVLAALGKTMGGQPTLYREVVQWSGKADVFNERVKDLYAKGFVIETNMAYMTPNVAGVQKVLREVTDNRLGRKLRYLCRAGTPEGMAGNPSDIAPEKPKRYAPIQPFTAIVMRRIAGEQLNRFHVKDAFEDYVTEEEAEYFPKWASKG